MVGELKLEIVTINLSATISLWYFIYSFMIFCHLMRKAKTSWNVKVSKCNWVIYIRTETNSEYACIICSNTIFGTLMQLKCLFCNSRKFQEGGIMLCYGIKLQFRVIGLTAIIKEIPELFDVNIWFAFKCL